MGIIIRQAFKASTVRFIAVLVGTLATLFVYIPFLAKEEYGHMRYIIDTAVMLVPFLSVGMSSVLIKYFHFFSNENGKPESLLGLAVTSMLIMAAIFTSVVYVFSDFFQENAPRFYENQWMIIGLSVLIGLSTSVSVYISNYKRIVVPLIFNQLWLKVAVPVLVLLYAHVYFDFTGLQYGLILVYGLALVGVLAYLFQLKLFRISMDWSFVSTPKRKEIGEFAFFAVLAVIGSALMVRIDKFMITEMLGYENNAVYSVASILGDMVAIPLAAVGGIASPIIAGHMAKKELKDVGKYYRSVSINLMVLGCLIFLLIWISIDDLFELIKKAEDYSMGKYVVLFIGLAKITDMTASLNDVIIANSKYFKFSFYALMIIGLLNIFGNYFFIQKWHIEGASIATLMAITVFNLGKMIYIKYRFGLNPLTRKNLIVLFLFLGNLVLFHYVTLPFSPLVNIIVRSIIGAMTFFGTCLLLKVSPQMNQTLADQLKRIGL